MTIANNDIDALQLFDELICITHRTEGERIYYTVVPIDSCSRSLYLQKWNVKYYQG